MCGILYGVNFSERYKPYVRNRGFLLSAGMAFFLFAVGIIVTYFAIVYATERSSLPVTDIILSNIPVVDVDGLFLYGPSCTGLLSRRISFL
jgi:hypothetical protein